MKKEFIVVGKLMAIPDVCLEHVVLVKQHYGRNSTHPQTNTPFTRRQSGEELSGAVRRKKAGASLEQTERVGGEGCSPVCSDCFRS